MIATAVAQDQVQLRLLKVFAEMCTFSDVLENATQRIDNVYQVLRVSTQRIPTKQLNKINMIPFVFDRSICPYQN